MRPIKRNTGHGKKIKSFFLKTAIYLLLSFSLIFILPSNAFADVNYPDYSGYVNDYAGILDSQWKNKIEELCTRVEEDTGAEIAVAIIDSLEGITIEEYAVKLFEKWGIGKQKADNGILLLIAMQDRKLRIEVGYGLEGVITDLEAGNIIDDIITPRFKQEDYNNGAYEGVAAIANEIYLDKGMTTYTEITEASGVNIGSVSDFFSRNICFLCCFPIFLIIALIAIIRGIIKRKCPKCHKIKLKIKNTIIKQATYTTTGQMLQERTCTFCDYHDQKVITLPKKTRTSSGGGFFTGGGGFSGGGGSSFGGFGGGSSGGGGASGGW